MTIIKVTIWKMKMVELRVTTKHPVYKSQNDHTNKLSFKNENKIKNKLNR